MSLLLSEGHPDAYSYAIPVVWTEARAIQRRKNREAGQAAFLMSMAIGSVLSEETGRTFSKEIEKLME